MNGAVVSRRTALIDGTRCLPAVTAVVSATALWTTGVEPCLAAVGGTQPDLRFQTTSSGLQWADVRAGTGTALTKGSTATIDYSMSTTGARYGSKIYSTANTDTPYRFQLGDGSTIAGIEQAILGEGSAMPPLLPGGIRRLVIPQSLGYLQLAQNAKERCVQSGTPGPIPPPNQAFEEYQRFKNIYCNPNRQYQPDLVLDIKLYGARAPARQ